MAIFSMFQNQNPEWHMAWLTAVKLCIYQCIYQDNLTSSPNINLVGDLQRDK